MIDRDADVRLRTRPFPIILSAPSGSGKTSVSNEIFKRFPYIRFAVSLTTRAKLSMRRSVSPREMKSRRRRTI